MTDEGVFDVLTSNRAPASSSATPCPCQALPQPRLADHSRTASRQLAMREEIRQLKLRLAEAGLASTRAPEVPLPREIMDDFYLIAQETAVVDNQVKLGHQSLLHSDS